jgi:hypothetical protein
MATPTLKKLPDAVLERLRRQAERQSRSVNREATRSWKPHCSPQHRWMPKPDSRRSSGSGSRPAEAPSRPHMSHAEDERGSGDRHGRQSADLPLCARRDAHRSGGRSVPPGRRLGCTLSLAVRGPECACANDPRQQDHAGRSVHGPRQRGDLTQVKGNADRD